MQPDWIELGVWLLVLLVAGLTVLAAAMLWRDGFLRGWRNARNRPPTCPRCGYNLSGLTYCRCPECGSEYRLEELWISAAAPQSRQNKQRPDRSNKHEGHHEHDTETATGGSSATV